jgi:hypothetical protein
MRCFDLFRHGFMYTLKYGDLTMQIKRFNSELEGVAWAENFISSWSPSQLHINFERQEDRT